MALWYTLTVLLAPAMCCCDFRPSAPAAVVASAAEAPKPAKSAPACSHCCAEPSPPSCPEDRVTPDVSSPRPHPCPCKDAQATIRDALPLTDRPVADGLDEHFLLAGLFALSPDVVPVTPERSAAESAGGLPFPSTDQLLRVFHRLRC